MNKINMNTKPLEVGEFILVGNTMSYIYNMCRCDQCKARGEDEPYVYDYEKGALPFFEGSPSGYWAKQVLPKIEKRTSDKTEPWVVEFLKDAQYQLSNDYFVVQKERLGQDIAKFVGLGEEV